MRTQACLSAAARRSKEHIVAVQKNGPVTDLRNEVCPAKNELPPIAYESIAVAVFVISARPCQPARRTKSGLCHQLQDEPV